MWDSPKAFSPEGQAKKVHQTKEGKLNKKHLARKVQIPHHTPEHSGSGINIDLSKVTHVRAGEASMSCYLGHRYPSAQFLSLGVFVVGTFRG